MENLLEGFVPRRVTGQQAHSALEHDMNPFTKQSHSAQYKKLLATRQKLPMYKEMDGFMRMFTEHQIIIVVGESGSGKTTQIPQFVACSDMPHTRGKLVACTQPSRIAAISAVSRVAAEMDVPLGKQVGYSVRFDESTEPGTTFLQYMTDDVLLREATNDPNLERYSTIILDEVQERTVATDILMGILKDLAKRREDIKIIITSIPPEALMRALESLNYLAALDDDGNLTGLGSVMAEFPLDPQLAKALVISSEFKCSSEILTIVAMLSVGSPWMRPPNARSQADAAKALFTVPDGDHLTLLNVYNQWQDNKHNRNWAYFNFLDICALRDAEEARSHLEHIMQRHDIELLSLANEKKMFENIRQVLVCGCFMQIAHREVHGGNYLTAKDNQVVALHPSCGLDTQPEWVVYNEFVLTTRPYIRVVSEVEPEWLLEFAANYFDLKTFPKGEVKQAFHRVQNKKEGKGKERKARRQK